MDNGMDGNKDAKEQTTQKMMKSFVLFFVFVFMDDLALANVT
jgi:hypothetical protein